MNIIKEKKINVYIVAAVLFICCGYSEFYYMRGTLAMLSVNGTVVFNDVLAFLFAALLGGVIYEAITSLLFRSAAKMLPNCEDMRYTLRFFYAAAFSLSGVTKTLYFYFPYLFTFGEVLIDFFYAAVFFALYIWYVCKIYCDAATRGKTVMYLGSAFLCFYGFVALVALLSGVTA